MSNGIKTINSAQITELISTINFFYGYDFSNYIDSSFSRRINRFATINNLEFFDLQKKLQIDILFFASFLDEITVKVSEFFRNPDFFQTIKNEVIPAISNKSIIRIWHAGCATGEEVYSMAILLKEAGILNKSVLYATDISTKALKTAIKGQYKKDMLPAFLLNYNALGGTKDLKNYYTVNNNYITINNELKEKIVFATHNLVSDNGFNQFNVIFCRNVLIYFNRNLQSKTLQLLTNSLVTDGFLALGSKESIDFYSVASLYETTHKNKKIYRKTFKNKLVN